MTTVDSLTLYQMDLHITNLVFLEEVVAPGPGVSLMAVPSR